MHHVHVDRAVEREKASSEGGGELVAGDDDLGTESEGVEEVEFEGGEVDGLVAYGHGTPARDDAEVAEAHVVLLGHGLEAAEDGADPGEELAGFERFGKVVVGAKLQTEDTVRGVSLRGEHDDGNAVALADELEHFDSAEAGKHDIENDEVDVVFKGALGTELTIEAALDGEAFGREEFGEHLAQLGIVVDDENLGERAHAFQGTERLGGAPDLYKPLPNADGPLTIVGRGSASMHVPAERSMRVQR